MKKLNTIIFSQLFVSNYGKLFFVLHILFILSPRLLLGQTLDEFRTTAATGKGVTLIPFHDLRKEATAIADEVQYLKNEVEKIHYSILESQKDNLLGKIKKTKETIIDEKRISPPNQKLLNEKEAELAKFREQVTTVNEKIEEGIETFKRLNNARAGLREFFDKALDKLKDARSHPEKYLGKKASEKDNHDFESYTGLITGEIEDEQKEHKKQETAAENTSEKFKKLYEIKEPH
jgi:chromosome segregation ATPase